MSKQSKKAGKEGPVPADTFEIGLVMGGAVSAGAYTAGVLDFLFETLDAWEAAKKQEAELPGKEKKIPPHNIKISVVAGGSAGGMIAAISAAELRDPPHSPLDTGSAWPESTSRYYTAWVKKVTMQKLLENTDLEQGERVKSILNTDVILKLADEIISINKEKQNYHRPYISDNLEIILPLANLRGVPYSIEFKGNKVFNYGMLMHKDHITFRLDRDGSLHANEPGLTQDQVWQKLSKCGVAAGIFPIGLAPQMISRKARDYDDRKWLIPYKQEIEKGELLYVFKEETIEPAWPQFIKEDKNAQYRFLSVDGGVFNNEPFDLARKTLVNNSMLSDTDQRQNRQAILMIDPFPETVKFEREYNHQGYVTETISLLARSLVNQGRFKIEDVYLSKGEDILGRYMMVPKRSGKFSKRPLACGSLGGFSGFFHEEFRIHDYFLGRRNCQRFLDVHFTLPYKKKAGAKNNPIFKGWTDGMIKNYGKDVQGADGTINLPIIPLMKEVKTPIPKYPYPSYSQSSLEEYRAGFKKRARMVIKSLLKNELLKSKIAYFLLGGPIVWWLSRLITSKVLKTVENNFKEGGLIRESEE
jgi:hypothetical protein